MLDMPSNVKASSLGSVKDNHMNLVFDSFLVVSRMTLSVCDSSQLLLKGLQGTWDTKRNEMETDVLVRLEPLAHPTVRHRSWKQPWIPCCQGTDFGWSGAEAWEIGGLGTPVQPALQLGKWWAGTDCGASSFPADERRQFLTLVKPGARALTLSPDSASLSLLLSLIPSLSLTLIS